MGNDSRILIMQAVSYMREYRMPNYDEVDVDYDDTGAIVAIIIYFMMKERGIGLKKLEYYIIILDRIIQEKTAKHLFNWRLTKGGRIRNFAKFIEFMIDKDLISRKGNRGFNLLKTIQNINGFPRFLQRILPYLDGMVEQFRDQTIKEVALYLGFTSKTQNNNRGKNLDEIINAISELIDKHGQEYEQRERE